MGSNSTFSHGDVVNPLVRGCLTGQLHALFMHYNRSIRKDLAPSENKLPLKHFPYKTLLKRDFLYGSICTTASLGIFEILTKRLRNANDGMPLTLYQEACCGFVAGSTATIVWRPFELACSRVGLHNLSYTNWLSSLIQIVQNQRVSTIWKCSSIPRGIAAHTGMLASYNTSLSYLTQTQAIPAWAAQISAGIISGFFAAASSHTVLYMAAIKGSDVPIRHIPRIIFSILNPHDNFNFYTDFLKSFRYASWYCMAQYAIFEAVRRVDWNK